MGSVVRSTFLKTMGADDARVFSAAVGVDTSGGTGCEVAWKEGTLMGSAVRSALLKATGSDDTFATTFDRWTDTSGCGTSWAWGG
ncbi:uncharacterized protein Dvar_74240 [Desulfosarcina variabilis str. Montpellier]|uniref:hypothetical protein n=1 Tax=Desulfosarcina variabilis TaxID=2300 RepID=UPI003AFB3B17